MDVVHLAKVSARIVLNSVPSRGDLAAQAREAVAIYDYDECHTRIRRCAPCEVGHRIAFVHGYNAGLAAQEFEPNGKAAQEVRALYLYLADEIGL